MPIWDVRHAADQVDPRADEQATIAWPVAPVSQTAVATPPSTSNAPNSHTAAPRAAPSAAPLVEVLPTREEIIRDIEAIPKNDKNPDFFFPVLDKIALARLDMFTENYLMDLLKKRTGYLKTKDNPLETGLKGRKDAHGISALPGIINANNGQVATPDWAGRIQEFENHQPKPNIHNCLVAFSDPDWNGVLAFNEFSQDIDVISPPPYEQKKSEFKKRQWSDRDIIKTVCWMQERGLNAIKDHVNDAALQVADLNSYHPVKEYFSNFIWDHTPRLDTWLHKATGCEDNNYSRAVGARWLVGCIARVYKPGCKFDYALIIEGDQGIGKSELFRILGGEWFTDDVADLGTKDSIMQIHTALIVELAELSSLKNVDVEKIKSFITRQEDNYRPPYAKRPARFPRTNGFGGTVNPGHVGYLKDETGNRRFWPIKAEHVDREWLRVNRDQLIAEAIYRYENGEKWWIDEKHLIDAAAAEQSKRKDQDIWSSDIGEFVNKYRSTQIGFTSAEILYHALGMTDRAKWTAREQRRVVSCLKELGFTDCYEPPKSAANRQRIYRSPIRMEEAEKAKSAATDIADLQKPAS